MKNSLLILCVNDEREPLELWDFIITQEGHRAITAQGMEEAHRRIVRERHLDLAIVNLMMPLTGWPEPLDADCRTSFEAGFAVARFVRSKFADIPLIFDSASAVYLKRNLALISSFSNACFLPNPFRVHDLLDKIRNAQEGIPFTLR